MFHIKTNNKETMMHSTQAPLIEMRGVSRHYTAGSRTFSALSDVSVDIRAGECVAIVGKSGSGKTTLINLLTGIDSPSEGQIHIAGFPVHGMSQDALTAWRGVNVGVIFQFFQLLPTLTVLENVMLPMDFCAMFDRTQRRPRLVSPRSWASMAGTRNGWASPAIRRARIWR